MCPIGKIDAEFANGRMVQEEAPECRVMDAFDHFAAAMRFGDADSLTPAGAVKREPSSAGFEPAANKFVLLFVRMGPCDIGDQEPASVAAIWQRR